MIDSDVHFKDIIDNTLKNKNYTNVVLMYTLYYFGYYLTIGFLCKYKIKDLAISLGAIQVINMIGSLARFLLLQQMGRFADKTSYARGFRVALSMYIVSFLFLVFTNANTWYLIIPFTILNTASQSGLVANSENIIYGYVNEKYFSYAFSIMRSISGFFGFAAAYIGGYILEVVQKNGNLVFGLSMSGQQVLALLTVLISIVSFLICKFVIEKQNVMKQ